MVKRILLFFLLLQLIAVLVVFWLFAKGPDGKLNWAQEAWRRMQNDSKQYCFDVIKESGLYRNPHSVRYIGGEVSGQQVLVHYRVLGDQDRFHEYVYECSVVDGKIDKADEREKLISENFSEDGPVL